MFNKPIHIVFNSSVLIPFILAIGISKILIEKNIILGIMAIIISMVLIIAQFIILSVAKKQMVSKKINISNVSQDKENWILATYITYFVPFFESYFGNSFTLGNWILVLIGVLLLILSRKTVNNPILKIIGYKIYSIETEQGVDMTLITRKELRNRCSLSRVIRLFEYYAMEV
ncbi:hypothetical protein PN298_00105 [Peptostreptococcus anaerobius]|uniref:hypothetical protein n=1 Tax=Peptostreptococcus anaerobius TaxID=1261 RepID=UPI00232EA130|nr:hypothetical protein [Peptostreptococcus anaerobius]MDB8849072.1 hypothetical protein [Peptostreptococcus anaerobius]MDB8852770.1 hypothetical protein [Peptostreptococcus anaerobius]